MLDLNYAHRLQHNVDDDRETTEARHSNPGAVKDVGQNKELRRIFVKTYKTVSSQLLLMTSAIKKLENSSPIHYRH